MSIGPTYSPETAEFSGFLNLRGRGEVYCVLKQTVFSVYDTNQSPDPIFSEHITPRTRVSIENTRQITICSDQACVTLTALEGRDLRQWVIAVRGALTVSGTLSMQDFNIISVLGRGSYGKVMLVERDQQLYAMKTIRKSLLIERKKVYAVISERNVLMKVEHPFIIRLHFAFQSPTKFYLGMDYVPGGELYSHMEDRGVLPVSEIRLYIAELALAIDYLHSLHIIYRDLKPENVMLDEKGHVKLTDFGFARDFSVDGATSTSTFCGTDAYLAPEIVKGGPYGKEVDWWALGVLAYEMFTTTTPFFNKNRKRMLDDIVNGCPKMNMVRNKELSEFISFLLVKNPKERPGFQEIKAHQFFADMDWDKVLAKETKPAFVPPLKGPKDVLNFSQVYTSEMAADSYTPEESPSIHDFSYYNSL